MRGRVGEQPPVTFRASWKPQRQLVCAVAVPAPRCRPQPRRLKTGHRGEARHDCTRRRVGWPCHAKHVFPVWTLVMAGIPAQVGEQGVSPAARRQTGRRVPWPDRRVGSASGLPPELRRAAQGRRRARQGGAWRYAPRHRTRRRAARAMVRARKAPVSQPRCSASPWPEICAGPAAPGLAGLTRCTAAKGTYKWILHSNADGCQLTGTAACAAPRRASFCLLRCTLRLLQARAATRCIRMDARSELACDAFRSSCCCTLLLYEPLEPCDRDFELCF